MDITPDDLFDKRPVPASQPATDADYLGAIERILDKADGFLNTPLCGGYAIFKQFAKRY